MPELPEVETIVRDLAPALEGRSFRNPAVLRPDVIRGSARSALERRLRNRRILSVRRRAKHVVVMLDSGDRVVIQLRMTGGLFIHPLPLRRPVLDYAVFRSALGNGTALVFRDVRRLGTLRVLNERQWHSYTASIGPEPLDAGFTAGDLGCALAGTRQAIKKVIMDQRRLAGVGNIYANEALFRAGVDPSRSTSALRSEDIAALHRAIRAVLSDAIGARGTTVRDYRSGTGGEGGFQHALAVYGRGGQPCLRCRTRLVTTHGIDGRSTTFCWRCQGGR